MAIRVQFLAQARSAAGCGETTVECGEPASVERVVELIAEKYGEALRRIVLDERGGVQRAVMLFVNDEQVLAGDGRELRDGDVVTIMPPIAGG